MQIKKYSGRYIGISAAAVLFMLLFAYNTSPLCEYIGVDSGMYLVIGRAMARGETLYAALFDHKGPLLFFINMLPQLLIRGTMGVWILELVFMAAGSIFFIELQKTI